MNLEKPFVSFTTQAPPPTKLSLFFSGKPLEPFFCRDICDLVSYYKGFIDKVENFKKWDYAKKLSNPFELINQGGYKSISFINPISRSYFKLLELITDFKLISEKPDYSYAALAEGPGGFVECFIRYRKKQFLGRDDQIQCMTLKSDSSDIPNWNKAEYLFREHNVRISYGVDGTGDLYKPENIKHYQQQLGDKLADLVTADGGFDYSTNFNQQEQMSSKLIFAEVVCALTVSRVGGHFVLKIFDIYTIITIKILYLLTLYYDEVIITKPHTSRPANSEKYVVCKGFRGITTQVQNQLLDMLSEWNGAGKKQKVSDISGLNVPVTFLEQLHRLNENYAKIQIANILKTVVFIQIEMETKDLAYLKRCQTLYAMEWCKKYQNSINYNSINNLMV